MWDADSIVISLHGSEVADDEHGLLGFGIEPNKAQHAGIVIGMIDPLEGVKSEVEFPEAGVVAVKGVEF